MKIAILSDGMWPFVIGGMQMHTYRMTQEMLKVGVEVDLFHPALNDEQNASICTLFSDEQRSLLRVVSVPLPPSLHWPGHYIRESYLYSKNILTAIQADVSRYDLIYIQGFTGWALLKSRAVNGKRTVPTILNFHGLEMFQPAVNTYQYLQFLLFRFFVKKNIRLADYVQSLGGKLTDLLLNTGISRQRILTCGNAIPSEWLRNGPVELGKTRYSFVFIGRFEARKGLPVLLRAFKQLREAASNVYLTVIGEVPLRHRFEIDGVSYLGNVVDRTVIRDVLDQSNFLVLPSTSEGMPTVVLEAMARGSVVIAPAIGALGDILSEENSILIEEISDHGVQKALAKAVSLDDDMILRIKKTSFEKVSNEYTWDRIAEKMILQFRELLPAH